MFLTMRAFTPELRNCAVRFIQIIFSIIHTICYWNLIYLVLERVKCFHFFYSSILATVSCDDT